MTTVSYGSHRSLRWSCHAPRYSKPKLTRPARDRAAGFCWNFDVLSMGLD
ncbi:hypothetical protein Hanom_Chr12g01097981 [Helianthus anomalus]